MNAIKLFNLLKYYQENEETCQAKNKANNATSNQKKFLKVEELLVQENPMAFLHQSKLIRFIKEINAMEIIPSRRWNLATGCKPIASLIAQAIPPLCNYFGDNQNNQTARGENYPDGESSRKWWISSSSKTH
jgi:hypothetical protein